MIGKIIKIHSDFYYVKIKNVSNNESKNKILECKKREKLKKEKQEIFVGDFVKLEEISPDEKHAVITEIFQRKNFLPRPSIANIDEIIVVGAFANSEIDFIQLNRYLALAGLYKITASICINKADLAKSTTARTQIKNIYEKLGYKIVFTSAVTSEGIRELETIMEKKTSVFAGMSGVGKSSLINKICPEFALKVASVSRKTGKGTHTTRHVEILETLSGNGNIIFVADSPGFSFMRFDTVHPFEIRELFSEIREFSQGCSYSDCLHLGEEGCNVLINLEKIDSSRYESYKTFVTEALEYKEKLYKEGHKEEKSYKNVDKGNQKTGSMVKISAQARKKARNTEKQAFHKVKKGKLSSMLDEEYHNHIE